MQGSEDPLAGCLGTAQGSSVPLLAGFMGFPTMTQLFLIVAAASPAAPVMANWPAGGRLL